MSKRVTTRKFDDSLIIKKTIGRGWRRRPRMTEEEIKKKKDEWRTITKPNELTETAAKEALMRITEMLGIKVEVNAWDGKVRLSEYLTPEQEQALLGDKEGE